MMTVQVNARDKNTPLADVAAGTRYRLVTTGKWWDLFIPCDAKGYPSPKHMRRFETHRRVPVADWFALIGFVIPTALTSRTLLSPAGVPLYDLSTYADGSKLWTSPSTGVLHVFPNDVPCFYWNNLGALGISLSAEP